MQSHSYFGELSDMMASPHRLTASFYRIGGIAAAIAFVLAWRLAKELRHR